jgi:hypothetical protein
VEHAGLTEHRAESFVDAAWGGVRLGNLLQVPVNAVKSTP